MPDAAARWNRIESIFAEAADLPPADRAAFLDRSCQTPDGLPDAALREEVESLLALDREAEGYFQHAQERLADAAGGIVEEPERPAPDRIGPWRLVRELGRGGMGTVYLAERDDGAFRQTVALKLVRPGLADDTEARFRAERQILAGLDHPNVARLVGGGRTDDGRPWLAMEYVEGETVTAYCDRRRLPVNERLALFLTVCEAVQFAHRNLVVHRDLKPSNVLVSSDGTVKLLDFGIAKLIGDDGLPDSPHTRTGQWLLTPEYAAPEQIAGGPITTATDVYSLGVLLYELLTGRRPIRVEGATPAAIERAVVGTEPTQPSEAVTASAPTGGRVPDAAPAPGDTGALRATTTDRLRRRLRGDLDRITMKALRKEPGRRYASAEALGRDVGRHLAGLPVEARPATARYRVGAFVRRHRAGVAAVALALLAVLGGAGVALWQAAEARAAQARAETEAETAEEVTALLSAILREADPERARGADVTVREALDRGAERVRAALAERPAVRAALLDVIGTTYAQIGLPSEGLPLVREALDLRLGDPDADPIAVATTRHNLAGLHLMLGDPDAAEPLLRDALTTWRTLPVGTTPYAFRTLSNLGAIHLMRGDLDGAVGVLSEGIRQARLTEGAEPLLPILTNNLAKLHLDQGHYAVADALFREALAHGADVMGTDHPAYVAAQGGLAETQLFLGQVEESEAAYREIARGLEARYPEQTTRRSLAVVGIANALLAQGRYAEADRQYAEALRLHAVELPRAHAQWAEILADRATIRLQTGRPAEALALAREAAALLDAVEPAGWKRARVEGVLGAALVATGQRDDGLRRMRTARDTLVAHRGAGDFFARRLTAEIGALR